MHYPQAYVIPTASGTFACRFDLPHKPTEDAAPHVQTLSTLLKNVPINGEPTKCRLTINNHHASLKWNIPLSIYIEIP